MLPIGFQSVYQSVQIEKGFAGFSLQAAITLFYYKGWNYKTEDLAFACIQAQGLPQLSLKLMLLFVGNAFGSSAKVLFASGWSVWLHYLTWNGLLSNLFPLLKAGKVETFFVSSRNLPLAVAGPLIN